MHACGALETEAGNPVGDGGLRMAARLVMELDGGVLIDELEIGIGGAELTVVVGAVEFLPDDGLILEEAALPEPA